MEQEPLTQTAKGGAEELTVAVDTALRTADPGTVFCAACGNTLHGVYCHQCGQKAADPERFTLRHLAGEFLREFTSLDGKVWSTIRLMATQPGQLVVDYLEGRGSLHVTPVKLYLIATAIYFVLFPYAVLNVEEIDRFTAKIGEAQAGEWFQHLRARIESGAFYQSYQNWYTVLLAGTVLLNTFVLGLAFRGRRFGEHLVFALNELSLIFLLTIPLALLRPLVNIDSDRYQVGALFLLLGAWLVYMVYAVRRVYRPSRKRLVIFFLFYSVFRELVDASVAMVAIVLAAR